MKSNSKSTKAIVIILFSVTLILTVVAVIVSIRLEQSVDDGLDPDDAAAMLCLDAAGEYYKCGWTCFPAGTKVRMESSEQISASGAEINIEEVRIGDRVISQDEDGKQSISTVTQVEAPIREHMCKIDFTDGETLELTAEHPLLTKEGWKSISPSMMYEENPSLPVSQLVPGDRLIKYDDNVVTIANISCWWEEVQTYNLVLANGAHTYFADNYLAHNKKDEFWGYKDGGPNGTPEPTPVPTSKYDGTIVVVAADGTPLQQVDTGCLSASHYGCAGVGLAYSDGAWNNKYDDGGNLIEIPGTYWSPNGGRRTIDIPATNAASIEFASRNPGVVTKQLVVSGGDLGTLQQLTPVIICDLNGYNGALANGITCEGGAADCPIGAPENSTCAYMTPDQVVKLTSAGLTWAPPGTGCGDQTATDDIDCFSWHWTACLIPGSGVNGYGCGTTTTSSSSSSSSGGPTPTPPPECGNGVCNAGESCDLAAQCTGGGILDTGECTTYCTYCGDGIVQAGEECDDNNSIDNDTCSNACTNIVHICGDGICDAGETCDLANQCSGGGILDAGECNPVTCTYCGDGIVQTGEECDDGNSVDTDSCTNACTVDLANCGNNSCDPGESCDGTAQCSGTGVFTSGECRITCDYCGDGILQAGEQCDDNNQIDDDDCSNACILNVVLPYCGDGIIGPGEECEPGTPGSCGPGGVCDLSCECQGAVPGLCGSNCNSDFDCPSDNVCANGVCRLAICSVGMGHTVSGVYSGVVSGVPLPSNMVCAANGCELTQCLGPCGAGGLCPSGMSCTTGNICVITYCAQNPLACGNDLCSLPPTALITDEIDIILLAILLTVSGVFIYRTDGNTKWLISVKGYGRDMFKSVFNGKKKKNSKKKSQKDDFEKSMTKRISKKKKR